MNEEEASWTAPTMANPNPHIQKAARLAQERYPTALIVKNGWPSLSMMPAACFAMCVYAPRLNRPLSAISSIIFVVGIDWGKQRDFSVISVFDTIARRQVALDRFNQIDYVVQRDRIEDSA